MSDKKADGPVIGDENFVNVDPEFANYANDVDKPLPISDERLKDHNLPEWYTEPEDKDDKKEEKKEEAPKPSTPSPAPVSK